MSPPPSKNNKPSGIDQPSTPAPARREARRRSPTVKENGPDPVDVYVGNQLRVARRLNGISQTQLAEAMGVSFQAVQKYEHGENRMSASRLYKAAQLLRHPIAHFFAELESVTPVITGGAKLAVDELELVRQFRNVKAPSVRDSLFDLVKRIGESDSKPGESDGE